MNKNIRFKHIVLILAALALTACGGGGGSNSGPNTLATGTFIKTVELPSISNNWFAPFASFTNGARYQGLILAQDAKGSGPITSLSFRFGADSTGNSCPNVTIRMGHTSASSLSTTFNDNVEQGAGSLLTVFSDATLIIPTGSSGDYFTIPLNGTFNYNGVDNLVVDIASGICASNSELMATESSTPYTALIWSQDDSAALTGSTWDALAHMRFAFAGGENYLDSAINAAGTGNSYPFNSNAATGRKVQLLYPAADVNGSGPITGIGFPVGDVTTDQTYTVTLKLGHSNLTELVDGPFADSYSDTPMTVATNLTFTVPAGIAQNDFVWLPVTEIFTYNGTDNLILEIETTDNSLATGITRWQGIVGTGMDYRLFADLGATDGTAAANYYFTKFRFNGNTVDAGLAPLGVTTASSQTLDGTADGGVVQGLYRPVDIGTGGMINSIAVRLVNDSAATTHSNYTIRMGHTDKTALNLADTFTSNMDENMQAYSGSLTIPAGLKAGDWITIPLDTPFSYDATRNLAILFSTQSGALVGNNVQAILAARYLDSFVASNLSSDTSPTLGPSSGVVIIRLQIEP